MPEAKTNKVLLLGCGLCAPPLIHYLSSHSIHVTVASRTLSRVEATLKSVEKQDFVKAAAFDISAEDAMATLKKLAAPVDLVISLLPPPCHTKCAEVALELGKHFCTSSYVSDAMAALGPKFEAKGLLMLNECGVDPGLDHMSAKKVIDEIHAKGGKLLGFYSICGGLPAPCDNNNPLGYKLSWSPRGVLTAGKNNALFLEQGAKRSVPGSMLYDESVFGVHKIDGIEYEWYPNRDSTSYIDIYDIPEVQTICRGTYRNRGWCHNMRAIVTLGLNSLDKLPIEVAGKPMIEVASVILNNGKVVSPDELKKVCAAKLGSDVADPAIKAVEWLGLFGDEKMVGPAGCALDVLCHLMKGKCQYAEGEKDMIVMQHIFEVEYKDGTREELTSTLLDYGKQPKGFSSMARTVSLPLAIAVRMRLEGTLKMTGLLRPVLPEVYGPILKEMETLGVKFVEATLPPHFILRDELKPGEERVSMTPANVKKMIDAGMRVTVEKSALRCFPVDEYAQAGCEIAESGSWRKAPYPSVIFGLKELPDDGTPLLHRHIMFAHCYKGQAGWENTVKQFVEGKGTLYDLEFLTNDKGRRVAAFGVPAGLVGMALGALGWAQQKLGQAVGQLSSWKSKEAMFASIKGKVDEAVAQTKCALPKVLIIGALGRCGSGAKETAVACGLKPIEWDMAETSKGGPFKELLEVDILINCIYLTKKIAPFLTKEMVEGKRNLSVFVDVSCDTSNPNNPFPFYSTGTTLDKPVLRLFEESGKPLDVVAIDHLPSLVPVESSVGFSDDLFPTVEKLAKADAFLTDSTWKRAHDMCLDFKQRV